jgi:hypothetical protein
MSPKNTTPKCITLHLQENQDKENNPEKVSGGVEGWRGKHMFL